MVGRCVTRLGSLRTEGLYIARGMTDGRASVRFSFLKDEGRLPPRAGVASHRAYHVLTHGIEPASAGCAGGGRDVADGACNPCTDPKTATETTAEILDNAGFRFRALLRHQPRKPMRQEAEERWGGRALCGR